MAGLAAALAARGIATTYVAQEALSQDRVALGWRIPSLGQARLLFATDKPAIEAVIAEAPAESLHICQGLRANGLVGTAQRALAARRLRQWVVMETVDDEGWKGWLRRWIYRVHVLASRRWISAFLATGAATREWLIARGAPRDRVFPFAYFLPRSEAAFADAPTPERFRVLFVGQLIERKRLDLLIESLGRIGPRAFELVVVGAGELEERLREHASRKLGGSLTWMGRQRLEAIPAIMASVDCLVLPSRFDGWGAVASEALMAGTPVICSAACGCREAVKQSGGEIFATDNIDDLTARLVSRIDRGSVSSPQRRVLATWARVLGAEAGADYLKKLIAHTEGSLDHPPPAPWMAAPARTDAP